MVEYIQCTNCGKKYGVNDKIRAAAGRDIKCKACQDTFMIVVHDTEVKQQQAAVSEAVAGWDPSQTMPPSETPKEEQNVVKKEAVTSEESADDDEELARLHQVKQKKKQQQTYMAVGLGVCLLVGVLVLALMPEDEAGLPVDVVSSQQVTPQRVTKTETTIARDFDNVICRQAAAEQWLIDFTVMHGEYTAQTYVELLEKSQMQSDHVRQVCANEAVIQEILQAATKEKMPSWFEAEIHALQGDTYAAPSSSAEAVR